MLGGLLAPLSLKKVAFLSLSKIKQEKSRGIRPGPFISEEYYTSFDLYELIESNEANNRLMDNNQTQTNLKN